MSLCICGCNQGTKNGNRYIHGHNGHQRKGCKNPHLGLNRQYVVNECAFHKIDSDTAYALGLLIADGNIRRSGYRILLASKDRELPEYLRTILKSDAPINLHQGTSGFAYYISIHSKTMYERLVSIGLTQNKSLTIPWISVPDCFMADYIRGIFDGDGCISITQRAGHGSLSVTCNIVSGSENFAYGLHQELCRLLHSNKVHIYKRSIRSSVLFVINICRPTIRSFTEFIYNSNCHFLRRKHNLLLKGLLPIIYCRSCGKSLAAQRSDSIYCADCRIKGRKA